MNFVLMSQLFKGSTATERTELPAIFDMNCDFSLLSFLHLQSGLEKMEQR